MTPEEYEAKKAKRLESQEGPRLAQLAIDLDALFDLETIHGDGCVARLNLAAYVEGLPTMVILRPPTSAEYTRFRDMFRAAKDGNSVARGKAADLLGASLVVYPSKELYKEILSKFPTVQDNVATAAVKLGDAKAEEQGKG